MPLVTAVEVAMKATHLGLSKGLAVVLLVLLTPATKAEAARIGLPLPGAQVESGGDWAAGFDLGGLFGIEQDPAQLLREDIASFLRGPGIEVVPLEARIPLQIEAEALEKDCDYVLLASLDKARGGKGRRALGRAMALAGPLAGMVPAAGSLSGAVAGQVAGAALSGVGTLASGVRAKDIVTFEYRLLALGSSEPVLENSATRKAKTDGEDVLSPLLETAATEIVIEVKR